MKGIPFLKVPEGYARLPGAGYEATASDLEGLEPEDYPDIHKLSISGRCGSLLNVKLHNHLTGRESAKNQGNTYSRSSTRRSSKLVKQTREVPSYRNAGTAHFSPPP